MANVKNWMIVAAGFLLGILYGLSGIVYIYLKAPSKPGSYEVGIQALIVVFCGIAGLAVGYLVAKTKDMIVRMAKPDKSP